MGKRDLTWGKNNLIYCQLKQVVICVVRDKKTDIKITPFLPTFPVSISSLLAPLHTFLLKSAGNMVSIYGQYIQSIHSGFFCPSSMSYMDCDEYFLWHLDTLLFLQHGTAPVPPHREALQPCCQHLGMDTQYRLLQSV